jgi:transposase-like protein
MVEEIKCPECKSNNLKRFGKKWVKVDGVRQLKQQYQCNDCGRITVKPIEIVGGRNG